MKYTITMGCGHEETVELFGKGADRERKLEYFQTRGQCRECWKKEKEEKRKQSPLVFCVAPLPSINDENGDILISVWFAGNTRPYKEEIKQLGGYRWSEKRHPADLSDTPLLCWNKVIEEQNLKKEKEKAEKLGAKLEIARGPFMEADFQMAQERKKEWQQKQSKMKEKNPETPAVAAGHRWNRKIYGREKNRSIYLDGEKVEITQEEERELLSYLKEMEEYERKKEEIRG